MRDVSYRPARHKSLVVGYSGSGKTTLTRLLLRFMDNSAGTIELAGVDIRDLRQSQLWSLISYVPQEPLLFHRSIAENIIMALRAAPGAEIEAAGKAALRDEFIADLPYGYDTFSRRRVLNFLVASVNGLQSRGLFYAMHLSLC